MPRLLYSLTILAFFPWALLHLLWRARRQPQYLRHWNERLGLFGTRRADKPTIWIHAVSVGETRAAQPLIAALRQRYPDHRVLITHMTPTGRQTSIDLFGNEVERSYLPYDTRGGARRFLRHFRPRIGIIMETELWPNAIAACRTAGIPLLLLNARLSERSAQRYACWPGLTRGVIEGLSAIAAVGKADARRFEHLGARDVAVVGNLKFDIAPPSAQLELARQFRLRIGTRLVLLCASTREGEEEQILDAWKANRPEGALLVIVPRHPQRFADVAGLAMGEGFRVQRRSEERAIAPDTDVWIGDSMSEMFAYYAAADVAFVGGSLLEYGSQNLIEPAACGVPILIGLSTYNFAEAARVAIAAGAALRITNATELVSTARALLSDPIRRRVIGEAGRRFTIQHRGATTRTMVLIEKLAAPPRNREKTND